MMPSLAIDIHDHLARYLAEEMSLSEFWDWFMPQTWDVGHDVDQATAGTAYDIQLLLFEFSDDLWTEDELRDRLRWFARDYQTTLTSSSITDPTTIQTGSS